MKRKLESQTTEPPYKKTAVEVYNSGSVYFENMSKSLDNSTPKPVVPAENKIRRYMTNNETFSCPLLFIGMSGSGKTTFCANYIYENTRRNFAKKTTTIVLILTMSSATRSLFLKLKELVQIGVHPNILYLYFYDDLDVFKSKLQELYDLAEQKKSDWTGKIYTIVDDGPEFLKGKKDEIRDTSTFWSNLLSRCRHYKNQIIFCVQQVSMIPEQKVREQIKIIIFFNRPSKDQFRKFKIIFPILEAAFFNFDSIRKHLPDLKFADSAAAAEPREYRGYIVGVNDSSVILNFSYSVDSKFIENISKIILD